MSTRDGTDTDEMDRLMDQLYEQYGMPLEAEHWGQFLVIAPDGRTMLGPDMAELARRALDEFGRGVFLYKVGEREVGRI